jgi:hypothetical protein
MQRLYTQITHAPGLVDEDPFELAVAPGDGFAGAPLAASGT